MFVVLFIVFVVWLFNSVVIALIFLLIGSMFIGADVCGLVF